MGKYINYIGDKQMYSSAESKMKVLIDSGAKAIPDPTEWREGLVCVVDNGWMAAAGYAYDEDEMNVMLKEDGRPKTWFYFPDAKKWAK